MYDCKYVCMYVCVCIHVHAHNKPEELELANGFLSVTTTVCAFAVGGTWVWHSYFAFVLLHLQEHLPQSQ
jgi:hypothetical protein